MSAGQSGQRESEAIVARIFTVAAQRAGGASALARHLGLHYSELRTYLTGEAMPTEQVLLQTVELVLADLEAIRAEFSDQAWRALSLPSAAP